MSTRDEFRRFVAQTSQHPLGLKIRSAHGPWLLTDDDRRIIDLISGIAVSALGHAHPEVLAAIHEQVDRHLHVMVYGEFDQEPQTRLAGLLAAHLPATLQVTYFTNSGAEAIEGALKLAKKHTGRSNLIAFERSYHGDTHGALSVTGRDVYRVPFEPLLPGVTFLPFDDAGALESIDTSTAAVVVEPIQGEGGVRVPSMTWIRHLRERTRSTGSLLIFDEIQTGMGRTGSLFAFEQTGVEPDILCLAKAFGGGMPLGAFISSPEIMQTLRQDPPLSHVTTFGGHPVSCAAGAAALEVIVREGLPARAMQIEERIRTRLRHPLIEEIRGRGAMLGMVIASSEITKNVVMDALEHGVLVGWTLHSDRLVRIAPPLNIAFDVLDAAIDVLLTALNRSRS
jgi:acetylornithine/succinyldiaminopimelate/putrescine aminotransferase